MKLFIAAVFLSALCAVSFGQAKNGVKKSTAPKMSGCAALPWEMNPKDWDVGQKLPAWIKKENAAKLLRPAAIFEKSFNERGEIVQGVGAKPWNYLPDAYLVVIETDVRVSNRFGGTNSEGRYISSALVKKADNSNFTVIAKMSEPLKYDENYRFNKFDLAPYKIKDNEYAFGLRQCSIYTGTGAINSSETLDLFRVAGENIEKILSTPIGYENLALRGSAKNDISAHASIAVSQTKTGEFFNLIKSYGKAKPAAFIWNGNYYAISGKDPFPTFDNE